MPRQSGRSGKARAGMLPSSALPGLLEAVLLSVGAGLLKRTGRIDIPRSAALDFIQEMITKLLVPLVAFLSLLLLPGTAFHVPEAAAQEGTTTTISGRVQVQGATGHDGVTVQLGLATALTAADGSFSFTGVQPGIYTLSAQATGYPGGQSGRPGCRRWGRPGPRRVAASGRGRERRPPHRRPRRRRPHRHPCRPPVASPEGRSPGSSPASLLAWPPLPPQRSW